MSPTVAVKVVISLLDSLRFVSIFFAKLDCWRNISFTLDRDKSSYIVYAVIEQLISKG